MTANLAPSGNVRQFWRDSHKHENIRLRQSQTG